MRANILIPRASVKTSCGCKCKWESVRSEDKILVQEGEGGGRRREELLCCQSGNIADTVTPGGTGVGVGSWSPQLELRAVDLMLSQ